MTGEPTYDPRPLLSVLERHGVAYVVIGGVAALLHGAPFPTEDLDVTPSVEPDNLERLADALREVDARLRTPQDPDGVSFPLDGAMLATATTWTLQTRLGDLDLALTPTGTGGYVDLRRAAERMQVASDPPLVVFVAALADVVRSKAAAGREKDLRVLPALRRALELQPSDRDG